jgi:hypothetical protein
MAARVALLVITAGLSVLPAQQKIESSRVLLVAVYDARARPIVDLLPEDFVVAERNDPREVFSVYAADYPIVLLLDTAAAAAEDLEPLRAAAERFVARIGAERPLAVGSLADTTLAASFDQDRQTVVSALRKLPHRPQHERAPLAAIAAAVARLREAEIPFSGVVVISAGGPDATPMESRADLLTAIAGSRTRVHGIAAEPPGSAVRDRDDPLRNASALTRGHHTRIFSVASYRSAVDRLADTLSAEIMVEYLVPEASRGAGSENDVQVGVKIPGARVVGMGVSR